MIHMGIQRDNPSCDVVPSAMQFVFNPNGEIGESPGQRPGLSQCAPLGRKTGAPMGAKIGAALGRKTGWLG